MNSIYDNTKGAVGIDPQSFSGTTAVDGAAVDTLKWKTAKAICQAGATTGTPTTFSVTFKAQDSADGSTGWADITDPVSGTVLTAVLSAVSTAADFRISDFLGVQTKRYIRLVATPAFTGGSSPTVLAGAVIDFGPAVQNPQNTEPDVQAGSVLTA